MLLLLSSTPKLFFCSPHPHLSFAVAAAAN
jgi:hypothetical protein